MRVNKGVTPSELNFDRVFEEEATQDYVYDHVRGTLLYIVSPLAFRSLTMHLTASVDAVLTGMNSTVFA